MIQLQHTGLLLLPPAIYFIYSRYYLHSVELNLLILATIALFTLVFNNWVTYIFSLLAMLLDALLLFQLAKDTPIRIPLHQLPSEEIRYVYRIQIMDSNKLHLLLYFVISWLLLRIKTTQIFAYKGDYNTATSQSHFEGFLLEFKGWSCTVPENTFIPLMCCGIHFLSLLFAQYELKLRPRENVYKRYLVQWRVLPSLALCGYVTLFNAVAFWGSQGMIGCRDYYSSVPGSLSRFCSFVGIPATTLLFLFMKQGKFKVEESENLNESRSLSQHMRELQDK